MYYPKKSNVVANALKRKDFDESKLKMHEFELYQKLKGLDLNYTWLEDGIVMRQLEVSYDLRMQIWQS